MVLYESHSVVHGQPFPFWGWFFANVFMHFEPIGSLDQTEKSRYNPDLDLPPYLIPGSKWEEEWKKQNPQGWKGVRCISRCFSMKKWQTSHVRFAVCLFVFTEILGCSTCRSTRRRCCIAANSQTGCLCFCRTWWQWMDSFSRGCADREQGSGRSYLVGQPIAGQSQESIDVYRSDAPQYC